MIGVFKTKQNITQSSPFPCDANNLITVSLASSVPLKTEYGLCNPTITISGTLFVFVLFKVPRRFM